MDFPHLINENLQKEEKIENPSLYIDGILIIEFYLHLYLNINFVPFYSKLQ